MLSQHRIPITLNHLAFPGLCDDKYALKLQNTLNIKTLSFAHTGCIFTDVLWLLQYAAIISLYSIKSLAFVI